MIASSQPWLVQIVKIQPLPNIKSGPKFCVIANLQNTNCLRQKPIDRFIVDFYCSSLRWVIEIDGDSHAEDPAHDMERTEILQSYGLIVIRYSNNDVMHNISGVYDDLVKQIS